MMNEREKRDMRELRAYYQNMQKLIMELQQTRNNIDIMAGDNVYSEARNTAVVVKAMLTLVIKRMESVSGDAE